jgi:uncharacterized membrane protein
MRANQAGMLRRLSALVVDACTCLGVLVIATGGIRIRHHPVLGDVNLMFYGPFLLPLAACLVLRFRPEGSRVLPVVDRVRDRIDALDPRILSRWVTASIVLVSLAHTLVVYLRHMSFQTGMDLAIYANACRGALYSTMKGDVWLFADHFEPLLILFTPLCRAISPAVALLGVQVLSFGIGAYGTYLLARQQAWSPSLAWLTSLLYLTFSGHVTILYYDFHLLSLTLGVIPWLWYVLQSHRYRWVFALGLFYLGLKESAALSLIGFGAFVILRKKQDGLRVGAAFMIIGVVTFALIMKVVYPAFRSGDETMYFAKYYGHLGNTLGEFISTFVTQPGYFARSLVRPVKVEYMLALLLPFLLFPIRRPIYLLPIAPAVLVNILSNDDNLLARVYHYEAEIYPPLFAMAVLAFSHAPRVRALWLAVMLVFFSAQSPLGIARWTIPSKEQRQLLAQLEKHAPHGRSIAAPQRIAAHLTDREKLYMFDYWGMENDWQRAEVVVIGYHGWYMGYYSWEQFMEEKLPKILPGVREIFVDPADPRFRMYETIWPHGPPMSLALETQ